MEEREVEPVPEILELEALKALRSLAGQGDRRRGGGIEDDPDRASLLCKLSIAGLADRKSTRLNSSHLVISYAVFCLKKKITRSRVSGSVTRPRGWCSASSGARSSVSGVGNSWLNMPIRRRLIWSSCLCMPLLSSSI